MNPTARILAFLTFNQNYDICDRCVASHLRVTVAEAQASLTRLARSEAFLRGSWPCSLCGKRGTVTRALTNRVVATRGSLEIRARSASAQRNAG
jgi:hypothetical protein